LPSINEREVFDPQDLYDPDSPGETFRVLKEKEGREGGENCTKPFGRREPCRKPDEIYSCEIVIYRSKDF
jgi:hypothetical protein